MNMNNRYIRSIAAVALVILLASPLACMNGSAAKSKADLVVWVHIVEIKAIDDFDWGITPADFYVKITLSTVYPKVWSRSWMSAEPYALNDDDVIPQYMCPSFNAPDSATDITVTIEVWDDDESYDNQADISGPASGNSAIIYYEVNPIDYVGTWSGVSDNYAGDPSGFGHIMGTEDGNSDSNDAEIWFNISQTYSQPYGVGGWVYTASGTPLAGATVDVYAWRYDNPLKEGGGGWIHYATVTTYSDGYFQWGVGFSARVMISAHMNGYYEERKNTTTIVRANQLYLESDQAVYQGTVFAMYGSVNDTHTRLQYTWACDNSYSMSVFAWSGATGLTYTTEATLKATGSYPSTPTLGFAPPSYIRVRQVVVHGTCWWDSPGKVFDQWVISSPELYNSRVDVPDPQASAPTNWPLSALVHQEVLHPNEDRMVGVDLSGSILVGLGLETSIGVSIGVDVSVTLRIGVEFEYGEGQEINIQVWNDDTVDHTYQWYIEPVIDWDGVLDPTVLGMILHCYEVA